MTNKIKAVSFDLWDTIIDDGSDEPIRHSKGLRSKPDERHHLVLQALKRYTEITPEQLTVGYNAVDAAFIKCWKDYSVTWTVRERLEILLKGFECSLPVNVLDNLADAQSQMEVDIPPKLIDGAKEVIPELAAKYKLCIVSDTIITSGIGLRKLLEFHGIKKYFSGFSFSDEIGRSKPHYSMFETAAAQLGVSLDKIVHIGDREHNDVKGAQAIGMKAVLFVAKRQIEEGITSADAISTGYTDISAIIERLNA